VGSADVRFGQKEKAPAWQLSVLPLLQSSCQRAGKAANLPALQPCQVKAHPGGSKTVNVTTAVLDTVSRRHCRAGQGDGISQGPSSRERCRRLRLGMG